MDTLFDAVARAGDPQTSWDAARSVESISETQNRILEWLRALGPATDEEIAWAIGGVSPSGLRTRRAELVKLGKVRDSGLRGVTQSGRQSVKWEAT